MTTTSNEALVIMIEKLQQQMHEMVLQHELATPSANDVSMRLVPSLPKQPTVKNVKYRFFDGIEVYPSLGAGFEFFLKDVDSEVRAARMKQFESSKRGWGAAAIRSRLYARRVQNVAKSTFRQTSQQQSPIQSHESNFPMSGNLTPLRLQVVVFLIAAGHGCSS
ncbi:hypothetical protein PPTG_21347 [Phytophthora nicotianae INRA-310]|uniref:Uncharacterized protein n=1 Tax=Phytophthora nicotianae (strain INRA-310) TaxID=761204 RepID=W2R7H4_PHYN3|nr:hypothetical protein PPTG_21347 [Phytophthora nicotianae INRA-310]ETN20659.1 hypothetical protein PPTG_21347 [Phytophthora nicotianae INRA-310]